MMKDHQISEIVNALRDAAITHHASGQLRERLRSCIEPLLLAIAPPVAAGSVDTEALRKLAQAATRGPWRHTRQGVIVAGPFRQYTNGAAQSQIASFCGTSHEEDDEHPTEKQVPNALFAAAACPDAVLALIERAEKAEANYKIVCDKNDIFRKYAEEHQAISDKWQGKAEDALARVKELEAQLSRRRAPLSPEAQRAIAAVRAGGQAIAAAPGGLIFLNDGTGPGEGELDCPACGGSGHAGDVVAGSAP